MSLFDSARHRCGMAAGLLLLILGCAPSSKAELVSLIREHGTRNQSRVSPKPLPLSKLQRLVSMPQESAQVDDQTQCWTYRFDDGDIDVHVIVETGNTWQDEDPMVFVDLKRLHSL
jgi:hypothetical protein